MTPVDIGRKPIHSSRAGRPNRAARDAARQEYAMQDHHEPTLIDFVGGAIVALGLVLLAIFII